MPETFHIAIAGSGPSGFYAAEELLRSGLDIQVDMFERLPTPYGLVRSGVAPDHPKLKQPIQVFERIAKSPKFRFAGNVRVGTNVLVEELRTAYHSVIFACGAQNDRRMDIPGETSLGSHTATEFVGWYNGHPDFRDCNFDLQQDVAVIVGQGNVAADVCRMLLRPIDELKYTDIAAHALEELSRSKVREVHIVGRRGPVQAKFTTKELRELTSLTDTVSMVDAEDLTLSEVCSAELASSAASTSSKNYEVFRSIAANAATAARRIKFHFFKSPVEIAGRDRIERVRFVRNRLEGDPFDQKAITTSESLNIECGLVFRSIGYKGVAIPGLPFDDALGVIPNRLGRIWGEAGPMRGLFVTGWLKRGPSGIIGTNRADSIETVQSLLADLPAERRRNVLGFASVLPLIQKSSGKVVTLSDWFDIDAAEVARGSEHGKPREKFTRVEEMMDQLARSERI